MLDEAVYEDVTVEQILDKRTVEGGSAGAITEYLVRWSDGTEDTWEPSTNIADDLIQVHTAPPFCGFSDPGRDGRAA
jgi:hypothetical protein